MASRKCEQCGGELTDHTPVCPACGTPVRLVTPTLPAHQKSNARLSLIKLIGIVVVCLLAGLLLSTLIRTREVTAPTSEVADIPNLEDLRAKAERGDAEAQKNLGAIYAKDQGVKQDYAQAAKWYRQAADQGHAGARTALGELYEAGQGVLRDEAEAAKWFRRAAEQGYAPAQYSLAVLYVIGKGVPQDDTEALKWYRQAADQGDALAQYNLGMRYYEGKGVVPDPVEAYKWLSLAAAQSTPDAASARDNLKRTMTREQITEGRRRAETFVAKKPAPQAR